MSQVRQPPITFAVLLANVLTVAFPAYSADTLNSIEVPGERAFPESISAAPDGTRMSRGRTLSKSCRGWSLVLELPRPSNLTRRKTEWGSMESQSAPMATSTSIRLPRASFFSASRCAKGGLGKTRDIATLDIARRAAAAERQNLSDG